jgi:hypothetical protein
MNSLSLQWRLYITGLITSDGVMTFAAFWVAYYLPFEWFVQSFYANVVVFFENYRFLLYTVSFLWLAIFPVSELNFKENLFGGTFEYSTILTCYARTYIT